MTLSRASVRAVLADFWANLWRWMLFAVATVLLATAAALVLGLDQRSFEWTLRALLIAQLVLLTVAIGIRIRAVGGRT